MCHYFFSVCLQRNSTQSQHYSKNWKFIFYTSARMIFTHILFPGLTTFMSDSAPYIKIKIQPWAITSKLTLFISWNGPLHFPLTLQPHRHCLFVSSTRCAFFCHHCFWVFVLIFSTVSHAIYQADSLLINYSYQGLLLITRSSLGTYIKKRLSISKSNLKE